MNTLGPQTITKIRSYIDEGVPLDNLQMTRDQIERVRVAERCYERLQQDPWLDRHRYLQRVEGRTRQQVILDLQVVDMFMDALNSVSRQLVEHRRDITLQRLARGAEQTGDLKLQERVLSHIERQLAEMGEEKDDAIKNTAALPGVLVPVEVIDPSKQSLGDQAFIALLKKYDGKQDQIDQWATERKEALLIESQQEETPEARISRLERELSEARSVTMTGFMTSGDMQHRDIPDDNFDEDVLDMSDVVSAANQFMDND